MINNIVLDVLNLKKWRKISNLTQIRSIYAANMISTLFLNKITKLWRLGLVVSSATEDTEDMGREIESRQGIEW
jgi:hypothetical protein